MKYSFVLYMLLCLFVETVIGQNVEQCRQWGLDPFHLSCETCDVLSATSSAHENCLKCCQSYKTNSKSTRRYGYAALAYPERLGGYFEEMQGFVENDLEEVQQKKGSGLEAISSANSSPYLILMDEKPKEKTKNAHEKLSLYNGYAKEIIPLRQWKRDDIKEMLLALLPDA